MPDPCAIVVDFVAKFCCFPLALLRMRSGVLSEYFDAKEVRVFDLLVACCVGGLTSECWLVSG